MIVWGAIVQANHRAFMAGDDDLPAVVAFSPETDIADDPEALLEIAHRVFALKGQTPEEPDRARIARLISDEQADYYHERVPGSLTEGRAVYISTFLVNRRRLPTGRLTLQLFPLLVDAARSPLVMILPLRYWGRSLVDHSLAAEAQAGVRPEALPDASEPESDVARPLSREEADAVRRAYSENPLRLTPEAMVRVREIIAECDLPPGVHLRVFTAGTGSRGDRQMRFSVNSPDVSRKLRLHYEGFDAVTDVDSAVDLTGVVLDFKDGLEGSGFIFRDA